MVLLHQASRRTTIKDVAELAGVSVATVSNVMRGTKFVAPELRERVTNAIETLGYRVDVAASGLRRRKSGIIAILVPNIQASFFSDLVRRIEISAAEANYQIILANTQDDPAIENQRLKASIDRGVEGLIWLPSVERSNLAAELNRIEIPMVILDREVHQISSNRIFVNNFAAGCVGAEHLTDKGHKEILFIARDEAPNIRQRVLGFQSVMERRDLVPSVAYVEAPVETRAKAIAEIISDMLKKRNRPTAIFCSTYTVLLGVLSALSDGGFKIPDDVSVLAFDEFDWMASVRPSISTISQPVDLIAKTAWSLLLEQLQGIKRPPATFEFSCRLIERNSVADINGR